MFERLQSCGGARYIGNASRARQKFEAKLEQAKVSYRAEVARIGDAGLTLEKRRRFVRAAHDARRLIAHRALGMALLEVGRYSEAAASFAVAIEMASRSGGVGVEELRELHLEACWGTDRGPSELT